jgi:two-component system sensor histidine kinase VicK
MRWWLALAFAGIAAFTALAIAQVFTARSEDAIRARARELAAGSAVTAALEISTASTRPEVRTLAATLAESRDMALFVLDEQGSLMTPARARGVTVTSLPNFALLEETALGGRRIVETVDDGRLVTVALPLRTGPGAALIGVATRPDLEEAVGIVRDEIVRAALWAVLVSALVGLGVALLITRRLRRIAAAAVEIEQGRFDRELRPRFNDELGVLAHTLDRTREHLRVSFERLEGERDRLRRVLEQLQEGVVAVDRDLVVEFANTRAQELLDDGSLQPGRALPEPWTSFSLHEAARSLFEPGASASVVRTSPDPNREYVVALLPPTTNSPSGVLVITDVTETERRERSEREFVTNAAHELRTPLAAIASAVEVLQLGAKERATDRDRFLNVVERQTGRLTRLANALLTLARAQTRSEPIRLERVAIVPLVREVARELGEPGVAIEACCEDAEVLAHRELLHQALENLAANARKHASGADLTFRVAHDGDRRLRIDVSDRGPGMDRHQAERVLDRFYRAPASSGDGFGLGLPIVREVVEVMGGALSIASAPGAGTTVSIMLDSTGDTRSCG